MRAVAVFLVILFTCHSLHAQQQQYKSAVIAFYNLENFFDTVDNPLINDDDFTPKGEKNYNSTIY